MFTNGLQDFKAENGLTLAKIDETALKTRKTVIQSIMAILLKCKLLENKEQGRLEMQYDFNHEDLMKGIDSHFAIQP